MGLTGGWKLSQSLVLRTSSRRVWTYPCNVWASDKSRNVTGSVLCCQNSVKMD